MIMTTVALSEPIVAEGYERCGARARHGGNCKLPAGHGTDHVGMGRCRRHGGNTGTHRRAIEGQVLEARARVLFGQDVDHSPVNNPLEVYAELAGDVRGWMLTMRQLVAKLDAPGYQALTGEQIRAEVQLYTQALDRCNTVLSTYARLGIDERLARITEAQQYMVMTAIDAALSAAGVSGAKAIQAKRAAAAKLRVVEDGRKTEPRPSVGSRAPAL